MSNYRGFLKLVTGLIGKAGYLENLPLAEKNQANNAPVTIIEINDSPDRPLPSATENIKSPISSNVQIPKAYIAQSFVFLNPKPTIKYNIPAASLIDELTGSELVKRTRPKKVFSIPIIIKRNATIRAFLTGSSIIFSIDHHPPRVKGYFL